MNIYEKLAAVMKDIQYLQKDDSVEFKSTKYKALSEEKVTTTVRQKLIENGLVIFPVEMASAREGIITHVDVKYRIVNVEKPDEFVEVVSCGDGADTQDKGPGKAMTYAFKYALLRTFAIPTGEDPDKVSSEELDDTMAKLAEQKRRTEPILCERCGEQIKPTVAKNGDTLSPINIAEMSKRRFKGMVCCADCQKALLEASKAAK